MKQGIVFGIQHFSIHDGSGIRTNVFMKGCPLRCLWCHNPEGLDVPVELQYFENRCTHCGRCGHIYRNLAPTISLSVKEKEKLTHQCWYQALELVGKSMTVQEILDDVLKDLRYFKTSQGGITVSGGEPMLQFEFVKELLWESKKHGLLTALETSGYADIEHYLEILPYVDQFLWDYKETDPEKHQQFTGVSNQKILENLDLLYRKGAHITLRCPIIPRINDTEEHLRGIATMLLRYPKLDGWEIMPYHKMGISKEKRLGKERNHQFQVPSSDQKKSWEQKILEYSKINGTL